MRGNVGQSTSPFQTVRVAELPPFQTVSVAERSPFQTLSVVFPFQRLGVSSRLASWLWNLVPTLKNIKTYYQEGKLERERERQGDFLPRKKVTKAFFVLKKKKYEP